MINFLRYFKAFLIFTQIYTQQKKKVDTFSTLIISYTNSKDGKCHISYEREINLL